MNLNHGRTSPFLLFSALAFHVLSAGGQQTTTSSPVPNKSFDVVSIRQNVANLGLFVCKQTLNAQIDPKPEKLAPLININRQLAAGLLGR